MIRIKYDTYNDYYNLDDVSTSYSDWFILGRFPMSFTGDSLVDAIGIKNSLNKLFNP